MCREDSLLFVLLLLKDPVVVGFPSLSFSWFSQSMFNDLQEGGEERGGQSGMSESA